MDKDFLSTTQSESKIYTLAPHVVHFKLLMRYANFPWVLCGVIIHVFEYRALNEENLDALRSACCSDYSLDKHKDNIVHIMRRARRQKSGVFVLQRRCLAWVSRARRERLGAVCKFRRLKITHWETFICKLV